MKRGAGRTREALQCYATCNMQVSCAIASVQAKTTVKLLNNILSSTFPMMMMSTLGYFVVSFSIFFLSPLFTLHLVRTDVD